ncbi:MAG: fumarylacetoacetate hydrolase family protein, partial [Rhizobiales bacterium]|nr:fumarylacetoacetate hydrolase family protein [Hyphomicrobiales bacterium]
WTDPLMYQGGSDSFLDPRSPIPLASEDWGVDFEAEVAVIVDDVPMGVSVEAAGAHIKLIMLVNDVSLRGLIPAELGKGFGFFHAKPSSAFSPVAVTPEELGAAWEGGKLNLPLLSHLNGALFGKPDAGIDMTFTFNDLIAHAAKTRPLCAGAIIGSGTVSNKLDGGPGKPVSEGGAGYSCIAEVRMIETIENGTPATPFMKFGDKIRIEMMDGEGNSIFGAIDQELIRAE